MSQLKLAVLSACDTAVADGGLNDPGSLVRLFLRAGVPQVIASKWSVDSAASSELMENLYARLLDGDSVELALAQRRASFCGPEKKLRILITGRPFRSLAAPKTNLRRPPLLRYHQPTPAPESLPSRLLD